MKYLIVIVGLVACAAILILGLFVVRPQPVSAELKKSSSASEPKMIGMSSRLVGVAEGDADGKSSSESTNPESDKDRAVEDLSGEERLMRRCPLADGFVFPVGPPDATGYYDAQPFGKNYHLGEDWNGRGGGNSDLGDPIYSIANGIVFFAEDIANGWGNVVRILHNKGTVDEPEYVDSLYAHLDEVFVKPNEIVTKGQQIGTMGNCDGIYAAHLHFEIRSEAFMTIGGAYAVNNEGYINPTPFLKKNRGATY